MKQAKAKAEQRLRRRRRIRAKVQGSADKPRISVYKSNRFVYAQLIDDDRGHTLASVSTAGASGSTDTERAYEAGKTLAEKAGQQQVTKAVFDRGGFVYKGRLASLADGAREGGLQF